MDTSSFYSHQTYKAKTDDADIEWVRYFDSSWMLDNMGIPMGLASFHMLGPMFMADSRKNAAGRYRLMLKAIRRLTATHIK